MRKLCSFLLALCLILVTVPTAFATEETVEETTAPVIRAPGQCGEDLYWSYDKGQLTISGTGAMDDYDGDAPWAAYRDAIRTVLLTGAVTKVGAGAFTDYDALETVEFGNSLQEVGKAAFKSCDSLTVIRLPACFRRFGEESFMSCQNLTKIYCGGGMPSFNLNCLWDTYTKIYFPTDNPWPLAHIEQLEEAFQGRIEFLAEDGSDPYVPPAVTEPEELPAATRPAETEPATVPKEQTEPAAEPETQPQTAPETEPAEPEPETEAPTQAPTVPETTGPVEKPEKKGGINGVWAGLFLITGSLSLVLLGALIFRRRSY